MTPSPDLPSSDLPDHVETTLQSIAALHHRHQRQMPRSQRGMLWIVNVLGRPSFVILLSLAVSIWIVANLLLRQAAADPPPFHWLEAAGSMLQVYLTILILVTQRHDDHVAEHRDQLTLQLAIVADQKTAKIIALLEELRRDHPELADRLDPQAAEMAHPADPGAVMQAIRESHDRPAKG